MAHAKKVVTQVQKMVTVDEENIVLELSRAEAETLFYIAGTITGSPDSSRRKHTDAIYYALYKADENLDSNTVREYVAGPTYSGYSFEFKNEKGI
jgi:hypothetical protein